ncbi:ammecr1 protein [Cladochytrium replicatum]|nr:ammecr1 protein [Cladochytrium replicatum]
MSTSATAGHCAYCFDVLAAHLHGRHTDHIPPPFENDSYPLFVTWNIHKNGYERLRGCIGNFEAQPLHHGLKEYALISALRDHRFNAITLSELPRLTCGVSLLIDFEEAEDYLDWEVGKHGIRILFNDDDGRKRTATYLPEVAEEQGWTKEEAIDSLLRKGGYKGKISNSVRESIVLTRYQSAKSKLSHSEYLAWKEKRKA